MPVTQVIDYRWSRLVKKFVFFSDIIGRVEIEPGFIFDWESVPVFRGTSKAAGLPHDYLSRKDSVPKVSKKVAADVYLEVMKYIGTPFLRRWLKYSVVLVWPGYFHKKSIHWRKERTKRWCDD
jgi:hypothetical protein